MGITLEDLLEDLSEDLLEELKEFKNSVDYYLSIKGYTPTDIDVMMLDLEQKLREVDEWVS